MTATFFVPKNGTWRASFVGSRMSMQSKNAMNRPSAFFIPTLRGVAETPEDFSVRKHLIRESFLQNIRIAVL